MTAQDVHSTELEIDRAKWRPSPEDFRKYLEREVQLARENIAKGASLDSTLHSTETIFRATRGI